MSEPSKAAISKACELLNAELPKEAEFRWDVLNLKLSDAAIAFALYIDKVSEVAGETADWLRSLKEWSAKHRLNKAELLECLNDLTLPEPHDPLLGVAEEAMAGTSEQTAKNLLAEIELRGGKIVWEAD